MLLLEIRSLAHFISSRPKELGFTGIGVHRERKSESVIRANRGERSSAGVTDGTDKGRDRKSNEEEEPIQPARLLWKSSGCVWYGKPCPN